MGLDSNLAGAAVWSSRIVCPDVAVGCLSRQVRAYGPSSTAGYCQPWDCSFAGGVLSPLDSYVELELLDFTLCLLASSDAQDASWVVSFRSQLAAVLWLCHSSTPSLNCGNLRCHSCSYCSIVPRFSSFRRRQTEVKSYVRQSLRLCMVSLLHRVSGSPPEQDEANMSPRVLLSRPSSRSSPFSQTQPNRT